MGRHIPAPLGYNTGLTRLFQTIVTKKLQKSLVTRVTKLLAISIKGGRAV
ncbi:hypothetical protein COO91_02173 [Nostoc flagelliforme CCNUN1]|uniref:Uncharacterized protein n=1 Tax=Nostoc flagelliforme CCNUN1 TaxID=2038116 RepID=A0A2K8SLN3_9NOSO|nr:hypothetical protein COO91_02173 [Nostoc flagelliforme CCNUN1]